jgi:hypothetical protein
LVEQEIKSRGKIISESLAIYKEKLDVAGKRKKLEQIINFQKYKTTSKSI